MSFLQFRKVQKSIDRQSERQWWSENESSNSFMFRWCFHMNVVECELMGEYEFTCHVLGTWKAVCEYYWFFCRQMNEPTNWREFIVLHSNFLKKQSVHVWSNKLLFPSASQPFLRPHADCPVLEPRKLLYPINNVITQGLCLSLLKEFHLESESETREPGDENH